MTHSLWLIWENTDWYGVAVLRNPGLNKNRIRVGVDKVDDQMETFENSFDSPCWLSIVRLYRFYISKTTSVIIGLKRCRRHVSRHRYVGNFMMLRSLWLRLQNKEFSNRSYPHITVRVDSYKSISTNFFDINTNCIIQNSYFHNYAGKIVRLYTINCVP